MLRCHDIGRSRLKKKQKVSNVGKDCEESANDNRSESQGWSDSYPELSKTTQRTLKRACNM
eukprot:15127451-Ditylum_brightwellii.AAC.1